MAAPPLGHRSCGQQATVSSRFMTEYRSFRRRRLRTRAPQAEQTGARTHFECHELRETQCVVSAAPGEDRLERRGADLAFRLSLSTRAVEVSSDASAEVELLALWQASHERAERAAPRSGYSARSQDDRYGIAK